MCCEIALQQEAKHFMSGGNEIIQESQRESDEDLAHAHIKKKKKSLLTKIDSSVLAMYFTRKEDTLQKSVMPSDPEVL